MVKLHSRHPKVSRGAVWQVRDNKRVWTAVLLVEHEKVCESALDRELNDVLNLEVLALVVKAVRDGCFDLL